MRIGVIQASSQATKNQIIYDAVLKYAPKKSEVINFGCTMKENEKYSYIEISILVGILLASRIVDFVVTGCSSGQVQFEEFVNILDISLLESIKRKQDVIQNVKTYGKKEIADLMK